VLGELLAPVVITTLIQLVPMVGFAIIQPDLILWLLIATAFLVPVNLVIYAVENAMFLTFPYRLLSAGMDPQAMARMMLVLFLKFALLGLLIGASAGLGGAAWFLSGGSTAASLIVSWLTLTGLSVALLPIVLSAYRRFDPGTDTPP
jgi:hypothetical protein